MTVADQIHEYIKAQLAKIRVGQEITLLGGQAYAFKTDAGALVDTNLEYTEHPDLMPSLVYYPGENTTTMEGAPEPELGMENHLLPFSVEGFISCGKAGTEAEWLKQDISCALKADPWFGGLIEDLSGFTADSSIQLGGEVFAIVKVSAQALYTVPFGSE
jgi:hypothetical protein